MNAPRAASLEQLGHGTFDLVVIGAGILGARVAYEAATAGLRVALVEAGDFGGATSSASSKLIHGGLRYYTRGHLRLVREAQLEKRILSERVAPHLIRRLPLVVAVTRRGISNPVAAAVALLGFWALSGFASPRPRVIAEREALRLAPALRMDVGATYLLLEEAITDDARLTLATVASTARRGAVVANHLRVQALEHTRAGHWRVIAEGRADEGGVRIVARSLVNATGPWVDAVRALERPGRAPLVRLSKGVHALLPLVGEWHASVSVHAPLVRNVFAAPWQGMLLLGTTDELYEGDPSSLSVTDADLTSLFADAVTLGAPLGLRRERVLSSYAGLRALPLSADPTRDAPREHVLDVSADGMVSVAGGKLTTHRPIALAALRRLPAALRPRIRRPSDAPLAERGPVTSAAFGAALDPTTAAHLVRVYGGAARFERYAALPDAFARIHPEGPDVWAQVHHAVDREWAITEDDVLRRRTTLALRGLATDEVRRRVRAVVDRGPGASG